MTATSFRNHCLTGQVSPMPSFRQELKLSQQFPTFWTRGSSTFPNKELQKQKEQAYCKATLATMTQQLAWVLGECLNLPCISTKQQARCEATLASTTQHIAQLLRECQNLPCISTKPPERDNRDIIPQPSFNWPSNLINKDKSSHKHALSASISQQREQCITWKCWDHTISTSAKHCKCNRTHRLATEKSSSPAVPSCHYVGRTGCHICGWFTCWCRTYLGYTRKV